MLVSSPPPLGVRLDEEKTPATAAVEVQLPACETYVRCSSRFNGWTDQYGALPAAAAYAGTAWNREPFHAIWQHGCFGPWVDYAPRLLTYNTPGADKLPVYVAREDQAEVLRRNGFARAQAIGLPIVYASSPPVSRVPRTLLVVPTHTVAGGRSIDRAACARYADEIKEVASDFDRVVICIHPSCRSNGLWIDEFVSRGLTIVDGANPNDLHALARMRMLFGQFDVVTTNGWGSHVAYALAYGARVSIFGTEVNCAIEDRLRDATWAADPTLIAAANEPAVQERKEAFLSRFRVRPTEAVGDVALGSWLIGAEHRLSPEGMKRLLSEAVARPADYGAAEMLGDSCSLLDALPGALRGKGREEQAAIWEVEIDGKAGFGICMQPPVDLTFRVPTGVRGWFRSAVCVHPLAWEKAGAGGCEFHLRIDRRVVHVVALDPVNLPADRHWHELNIAIPDRADGFHEIFMEVRPVGGSNAYRWGIWRAPVFSCDRAFVPSNPPKILQ